MTTFGFWEPILVVCFLNIVMVCGLYVNALSGVIQLCTAAIAGIGGYAAAVLTTNFGWSLLPSSLAACVAGAVTGAFLAIVTARMALFVLKLTTLAFGEAVLLVIYNTEYLGGANSFTGIPFNTTLLIAASAALFAVFVAWIFDASTEGYAARAVRDDPIAAGSLGISVTRTRLVTFSLGAALIGLGGSLQAQYLMVVNPHGLGFYVSMTFVMFLIVGGMQTLHGPIIATIILTIVPETIRFAGQYRLIMYGFFVVAVILLRPNGLSLRRPMGASQKLANLPLTESALRRPR